MKCSMTKLELEEHARIRRSVAETLLNKGASKSTTIEDLRAELRELSMQALGWEWVALHWRIKDGFGVDVNTRRAAQIDAILGTPEEQVQRGANNWEADRPDRDERERKEGWVPQ